MRPNEQMENAKWYAVFMRPKMEKHVASVLRTKGYEVCLPCYRTRRKWSDRYQWVELPLFPTYLFCQFDLRDKLPILTTPGVIRLVGHCRAAEPVDEIEMMNLMALVRSGLPAEPWPLIRIGDRARIIAGAGGSKEFSWTTGRPPVWFSPRRFESRCLRYRQRVGR